MEAKLVDLLQKPSAVDDGSLKNVVKEIMASKVYADMENAVQLICDEKVASAAASKEAMKAVAEAVDQFDDVKTMRKFEEKIVQCTASRQNIYEDILPIVFEKAAAKFEAGGLKKEAVEELSRLFDCLNKVHGVADPRAVQKSAEYLRRRVDLCVRAATLQTELGDVEGASRFLVRASDKVSDLPAGDNSVLRYKMLYAKLFDMRHDFIRAAQKYAELMRQSALSPEESLECLKCCARCVILSDAGAERKTIMSIVFKDERTASLPCLPFLKKIQQERILRPADIADDVAALQGFLLDYQKTPLANEKMTPLEHSIMLHNLFSSANIYLSIRLDELALLLGVKQEEAEAAASEMIRQKRINGKIDQVAGILRFNNKQDPLSMWDSHIDDMCNTANDAADMISRSDEMH